LRSHEEAGSLLEQPLFQPGPTVDHSPAAEQPGAVIGPYKLIEPVGEGGMGTVWMAQQTEPVRRVVAVKLIKPGMDSKQVLARFEAERQALALMDHPNIARVLDAGATAGGRPYFVMDLVKGVPITHYCDEHHLTPRQRLELFLPICQAVQHAHQKGIIHRDIKPSNVLVALYDGKPVPKVIDFGVAKAAGQSLTDKTLVTGFGNIVGTLEYMSPEQAEVNQLDIDTRSDIYSLGVLLYELLAGSPPFTRKDLEKAGMLEMLRVIREQEPSKPSTKLSTAEGLPTLAANRGTEPAKLTKLVRGELDWIVMKALEKDRNRRYETANGFAADVQRYLADEAVQACPPSVGYRLRKFARRNKRALTVAGLILFFILLLGGGSGWVLRDRFVRLATTERETETALAEAAQLAGRKKWLEALAWVQRAEGVLAQGADSEALRRRVQDLRRDLEMVAKLEEIRPQATEVIDNHFDSGSRLPAYAQAFREYGIDVNALDAEEAAERIRARTIPVELVAALDDWARWTAKDDERIHLSAVARLVDPDSWRNRLRDARQQMDRNALEALAASDEANRLSPQNVELLASALARAGVIEQRLTLMRQAQQRHPDDFWINSDLGVCLFFETKPARPQEAVRFLTAAVALRPRNPGAHYNLGLAFQKSGSHDEAVAAFREALRFKPDYFHARFNLGDSLKALGQVDKAIAEYREAIRSKADDALYASAHYALGHALSDQKKWDEAIAEYREAIRLKASKAGAHYDLANALYVKGRLDEAISEYREAIRLKPDFAEAHVNLGRPLHDKGQIDDAIAEYREAIRLKKDLPEAHYGLGFLLDHKGQRDAAMTEYREAIRLKPDYAEAHVNLGIALASKGQPDAAIAEFREAIRIKKDLPEVHGALGVALVQKGQTDDAIAEFREAIRLKKDDAEAHYNLGHALRLQGEFPKALEALRRGHELGSKDPRWPNPSARWVRQCEREVELDRQLPGFLAGKTTPANADEHVELAEICAVQLLNRAAARFFAEGFAREPKLADDLDAGHRYNAACTAAKAGCGQGKDIDKLDSGDRARLRRQALDWLRADLEAWGRLLEKAPDKARSAARVTSTLRHWLVDADFAGVREPEALAKLPEAERQPWQKLWGDVAATLARIQGKKLPEQK
jgi:serine/threonine protein kinase/Flp pilus assembly protein TadD